MAADSHGGSAASFCLRLGLRLRDDHRGYPWPKTYVDLSAESAAAGGSPALGGYLATPSGAGPFPAVLMIHEAFGLNALIRGHADRLARAGYLTLAVDLFSDGGARRCLVSTMHNLGIENSVKEFPTAGHAFLNETDLGPAVFRPLLRVMGIGPDPESSPEAWRRIENHFARHLKAPDTA